MREGVGTLFSPQEIPPDYFFAIHDDPQAAEAMYQLHAARVKLAASEHSATPDPELSPV